MRGSREELSEPTVTKRPYRKSRKSKRYYPKGTNSYCKTFKTKKPPDTKENGNKISPVFVGETKTFICNNLITANKEDNANS